MKAIKLYNIKWDLSNLSDEEKEKILPTLPKNKGFVVDDDFVAVERVPVLLKKKYGYDFITYSISEIKIIDNIIDLLHHCANKGEKPKDLFKVSGELSGYGEECYNNLVRYIRQRLNLEREGVSAYEMPKILDEVMLALEKITGMDWDDDHNKEEWVKAVDDILQKRYNDVLIARAKQREAKKAAKKELKKAMKDEGDSDLDNPDDEETFDNDEDFVED